MEIITNHSIKVFLCLFKFKTNYLYTRLIVRSSITKNAAFNITINPWVIKDSAQNERTKCEGYDFWDQLHRSSLVGIFVRPFKMTNMILNYIWFWYWQSRSDVGWPMNTSEQLPTNQNQKRLFQSAQSI